MSKSKQEQARASINEERVSALFPQFENISLTRVVIELFISMLYGVTLGIAINNLTYAFVLLGFPVFVNFIVWFALLAVGIVVASQTAPLVASTVYEAGATACNATVKTTKRAVSFMRDKLAEVQANKYFTSLNKRFA